MMSHVRWSDVRHKHVDAIGAEEVERGKATAWPWLAAAADVVAGIDAASPIPSCRDR